MARGCTGPGGTGKGALRAQPLQPVMVKPLSNLCSWAPWGCWQHADGIDLTEKKYSL